GVVTAAMTSSPASADLVGLRFFREGSYGLPNPPGPPLWIYRVYAEFTEPSDSIYAWGGGPTLGSAQIANISITGSPGTGFTNTPNDPSGNLAPDHPYTARDWDTYMTI